MREQAKRRTIAALVLLASTAGSAAVGAVPKLRAQTNQRGDFVLIGNTLAHECAAAAPTPILGTIIDCGDNPDDAAPDIYWRSDSPAAGQAEASTTILPAQARSTAVLSLPPGASVTHAFLYWGAERATAGVDMDVTLARPGVFSTNIAAQNGFTLVDTMPVLYWYQAVADVTATVKTHGSGAYRLSDVDAIDLVDKVNNDTYAGWWMVVFYELVGEPLRNLTLFDGLSVVNTSTPQEATVSGFIAPNTGIDARLGVVAYEGDTTILGDALAVNDMAPLSDALNASDNFFNGTRSLLGTPVSIAGDLPRLEGKPRSMSGLDLDIVDIAPTLAPGASTAKIKATSTGDQVFLAGLVTSIVTVADQCASDSECVAPKPHCDTAATPNVCVACLTSAHCPGSAPTCDPVSQVCTCVPAGSEVCNGLDDNCDGGIDEGDPGGGVECSTGLPSVCASGTTMCVSSVVECVPVIAPGSEPEECGNEVDEDCDDELDNGCGAGGGAGVGAGGGAGGGVNSADDGGLISYDGCICGVRAGSDARDLAWTLLAAAGVCAARRRRRGP